MITTVHTRPLWQPGVENAKGETICSTPCPQLPIVLYSLPSITFCLPLLIILPLSLSFLFCPITLALPYPPSPLHFFLPLAPLLPPSPNSPLLSALLSNLPSSILSPLPSLTLFTTPCHPSTLCPPSTLSPLYPCPPLSLVLSLPLATSTLCPSFSHF